MKVYNVLLVVAVVALVAIALLLLAAVGVKATLAPRSVSRATPQTSAAEVGDITRFPSARHLCAWAGLTPTVRSSDGRARLGHITGQGSPALRWALVEAAQHSARGGGPLRQAYERISKRRGKSVAKVAVARKILTLCYYGLRDGEIRCLTPRAKARTIRTVAVAP